MTTTHTSQDRIARVRETEYSPAVQPVDEYNRNHHCTYCNKSIDIGRHTFEHVLSNLLVSNAVNGNTDIKTRHRTVEVWSAEGNTSRMTTKEGYEHQIEAYSCDHQCYTLMIGIRSAYRKPRHSTSCGSILVEIEIPFNKEVNLPLSQSAYKRALALVEYLASSYSKGRTTLDYWEDPQVGMYKIMYYYKRYIKAAPLQKGYQRIINLANSEAKTNQVKLTERLTSRISTTDQATQTDNDQYDDQSTIPSDRHKGKSRDMTYWETVI